jgi:hypothetical protein
MAKKRYLSIIGTMVIVVTILFTGCAVNTGLDSQKVDIPEGYGLINVELMGATRSMSVSSYHITATKSGETDVTATTFTPSVTLTLKLGTWNVAVVARNSEGVDVYYGYNDVNVVEGGTTAKIGLAAKTGAVKYTVDYAFADYVTKVTAVASRSTFTDRSKEVAVPVSNLGTDIYVFDLLEGDWNVVIEAKDASDKVYFDKTVTESIVNNVLNKTTVTLDQAALRTISMSPVAGAYDSDTNVTLSTPDGGATIHYTTDGSTPTTGSPVYSGAIAVAGDGTVMTIKAIAAQAGLTSSDEVSGTYSITYNAVAAPSFSPLGGTYNADQSVTLSSGTAGATILYSTDGSVPSLTYSSPITVTSGTTTIRAIATKSGMADSSENSEVYTIDYPEADTPSFNPVAGTYNSIQNVNIFCSTPSSTIHYTTDGSTPTLASPVFGSSITLDTDGTYTIKAIAEAPGYDPSLVGEAIYTIDLQGDTNLTFELAKNIVIEDVLQELTFSSQSVQYLSFEPASAGDITIEWSDSADGDGSATADVKVTLIENDMETINTLNGVDNGYAGNAQTVSLSAARYFLKVESMTGGAISGTYKSRLQEWAVD